jgi:hypothetical protein
MTENIEVIEAVYRGFIPRGTGAKAVYQLRFEVSKGQLQHLLDVLGEYLDNEPQWVAIAPIRRAAPPKPQPVQTDLEDFIRLHANNPFISDPVPDLKTISEMIDADQHGAVPTGEIATEASLGEGSVRPDAGVVRYLPTADDQLNAIEDVPIGHSSSGVGRDSPEPPAAEYHRGDPPEAEPVGDPVQERRDWVPPKNWGELKLSQRYGILCKDKGFQEFLSGAVDADEGRYGAAEVIRVYCGIESGAELVTQPSAAAIYLRIEEAFRAWKADVQKTASQCWEEYVTP